MAVIGTYWRRIDAMVCISGKWKSGFRTPVFSNKVQADTALISILLLGSLGIEKRCFESEIDVQIPIRLLADYCFHEKAARCPSSYPNAFRLLPKSGSSKVCFELLKTFRVTPRKPCRLVAPPKSGDLNIEKEDIGLFLISSLLAFLKNTLSPLG